MDKMTLTLNSPPTKEDWDVITDVDFDCTNEVWFHTKHGKDVEFVKVVRCGECKHYNAGFECLIEGYGIERPKDWFCADGQRREDCENDG